MAILTNSVSRYDASVSVREDFADVVYNISPTDCPLLSNAGRDTAKQTYTEWQTDVLASAVSTNAQLEGDDTPAVDTFTAATRVGNYCQISRKVASVTGTIDSVGLAGIKSMMGYQMAKKAKELKRDMETTLCSDQVGVTGSNAAARKTAALGSWVITNWYQVATGGSPAAPTNANGYPQTAAVDGTTNIAFTETHLKTELQTVWTQGGDIDGSFLMVGPHNKAVVSGFTGIATRYRDTSPGKQAQIIGAADIYVGDFGTINVVPNRFQPDTRAYIVDPAQIAVAYLRSFQTIALAKTGDNTKRMLLVEYGLKVRAEKGLGIIRGITAT